MHCSESDYEDLLNRIFTFVSKQSLISDAHHWNNSKDVYGWFKGFLCEIIFACVTVNIYWGLE